MRQRNRTSSSSAHSANAALNAKITNSSRLADYLRKVSTFQKLSSLGQKLRHPLQSHASLQRITRIIASRRALPSAKLYVAL